MRNNFAVGPLGKVISGTTVKRNSHFSIDSVSPRHPKVRACTVRRDGLVKRMLCSTSANRRVGR